MSERPKTAKRTGLELILAPKLIDSVLCARQRDVPHGYVWRAPDLAASYSLLTAAVSCLIIWITAGSQGQQGVSLTFWSFVLQRVHCDYGLSGQQNAEKLMLRFEELHHVSMSQESHHCLYSVHCTSVVMSEAISKVTVCLDWRQVSHDFWIVRNCFIMSEPVSRVTPYLNRSEALHCVWTSLKSRIIFEPVSRIESWLYQSQALHHVWTGLKRFTVFGPVSRDELSLCLIQSQESNHVWTNLKPCTMSGPVSRVTRCLNRSQLHISKPVSRVSS